MTPETFAALVDRARYSPSVHNIQPTRWRLEGDTVFALQAEGRALPAGDPTGRDLAASHGSAVEGIVLAAGEAGLKATVERLHSHEAVARIALSPGSQPDPLAPYLTTRRTYRGRFGAPSADVAVSLAALDLTANDLKLTSQAQDIAEVARLNDQATLRTFRQKSFRAELLSWMRLSPRHPRWARDGLNARAMEMSPLEAAAAGVVLKPVVFEAVDMAGMARLATSEAPVVHSAAAVGLFHRPTSEDPFDTGRAWHRLWLTIAAHDLSAAPMTVLGDDAEAASKLHVRFSLPRNQRIVTVFRIGKLPKGAQPADVARLPVSELIV